MREAMMAAPVGDDVFEDDPTVIELETKCAELFGVQASLFVPSGTMGNQASLYTHAHRGDELILDDEAHIDWYEVGAAAALSGLQIRHYTAPDGIPNLHAIESLIRPENIHHPKTGIIAVENTHNRAGGVVVPLETIRAVVDIAHRHDAVAHLDGARIWNAAAATGIPLSDWVQGFDSVSVCLSKGMGAPVGSMILGTREFIKRARRTRKMFGGGMRQAGILAAAGIWAIDNQFDKLVDDHKRAKTLADGIRDIPGIHLIPDPPPTNIVVIELADSGKTADEVLVALKNEGVWLVPFGDTRIRAVTHRDVGDEDVATAVGIIRDTLTR
ncbi:MAG: aminotransferase class I/II-fold pyridoxal phosphate-dependent enzyme [candidate division Zixibacteria bacterium]|nr:aminotransferase class I/II-fold pyridoxal phosphate-dependent enzyme [candidate division Zixibacteria bacterium]